MPRDRRDELSEEEGGSHGKDSHDGARRRAGGSTRSRSRSRSRSPRRRPAAEDFYRVRSSPEREEKSEGGGRSHRHHHRERHRREHRHHSRDDVASRSPTGADADEDDARKRHHHRHHHHRHHHRRHHHRDKPKPTTATAAAPEELPYNARPLSYKHDLDALTPLFAYYLDVQKSLDFYGLDPQQARGRWKSFVNRWNRGGLAEGWYDPEMFERISREAPPPSAARDHGDDARGGHGAVTGQDDRGRSSASEDGARGPVNNNNNGDSDSDYGPPPPPGQHTTSGSGGSARKGPGIPTMTDLALQRESAAEERESQLEDLRKARKADRAAQKERLEELVPRAEPGTRERRLEKKAAVNEKMKGFREGADAGVEEVGDGDLMGGGDSVAELKRAKALMQRKKTERELRREAEARAREEERLERLREWREREEEKLRGLKELARARFG
ncbi:hypothetical protein DHEL01_v203731 [Diaporthe helianthi]|uniref:RNA helicase HEL117 n=1 Tax=Diaporthe helianthi TaxID=158607 RepID=A0A2P5I5T9_DIAHE|nr:hypothetical protein DHEL01_v203731 [Diaporthe helianthi]